MGKVRYFNGNNHIQLRGNIEDYVVTSMTAGMLVLEYDDSVDPLPEEWPAKVEFIVADGVLEPWEGGPNDGEMHYTGGTLTGVILYDDTGAKVMSMSGLDLSMTYVASTIEWDSGWNAVDHILSGGHKFIGSNMAVDGDPFDGDRINTGLGNDIVRGRDGNDYFDDVGGRDIYNGGAGTDWVGYSSHRWADRGADSGIVVRFDKGFVIGTDGLRDTIKNIEGIQGSMFDDRMIGDSKDNRFEGMAGNDFFNGKGGWDKVQYSGNEWVGGVGGIRVNLARETARDEFGNRDTLRNIEEVRGTNQNDWFRDDNKDNWFSGDDGDDIFSFGRGNDGAYGGAGADTFKYRGDVFGNNYIEDFEDGVDMLQIQNAPDFASLTITPDGADTLVQWNGNEVRLNNVTSTDITEDDFIFVI